MTINEVETKAEFNKRKGDRYQMPLDELAEDQIELMNTFKNQPSVQ